MGPRSSPEEKQGRKTVLNLDRSRTGEYTAELDKVKTARAVLKRFDESVRGVLREMPAVARAEAGYELRTRGATRFTPRAAEALHERLGNRFYDVVAHQERTRIAPCGGPGSTAMGAGPRRERRRRRNGRSGLTGSPISLSSTAQTAR